MIGERDKRVKQLWFREEGVKKLFDVMISNIHKKIIIYYKKVVSTVTVEHSCAVSQSRAVPQPHPPLPWQRWHGGQGIGDWMALTWRQPP